jgi:hypothetical protein
VANRLVPIAKLGSSAAPTIHRADFARDQAFAAICGRAVDTDHESSALVLQGSASAIVRWHPARIPRIGFTRQRSQVRVLLRPLSTRPLHEQGSRRASVLFTPHRAGRDVE